MTALGVVCGFLEPSGCRFLESRQCQIHMPRNHMSTIKIVGLSYHCHDSNTDDSHTIATIASPSIYI